MSKVLLIYFIMKKFGGKANKKGKHTIAEHSPKAKKLGALFARLAASIIIILAVVLAPTLYVTSNNLVNQKYGQKLAEYQGVVELWNIDSFEGGTNSKTSFLQARCQEYQKVNKGFYVLVRNMSEAECLLALADGQRPAMFSFGVGVGSELLQYLSAITPNKNNHIRQEFITSASHQGTTYALPWCRGVYSLISTKQNLTSQGLQDKDLGEIALTSGYTKTLRGGKTKTVYSLSFGGGGYTTPQAAFANNYGVLTQTATSYSSEYSNKTNYDAYCDFVEGKANILLGTQRDLARMENRISQGKAEDVIYKHITNYTDLVQYIAVCNATSGKLHSQCLNFADFLTSTGVQQKLNTIGMFAVCNLASPVYTTGEWAKVEKMCSAACSVQNLFYTKDQIVASRSQYMQIVST